MSLRTAWPASVAVAALAAPILLWTGTLAARVPVSADAAQSTAPLYRLIPAVRKSPIPFEPNVGQASAGIEYFARANGYLVGLTEQGLTLKLEGPGGNRPAAPVTSPISPPHQHSASSVALVYIRPVHARTDPPLQPEQRLASVSNYFIGNNPKHWHTRIPNYAAVRYRDIYPGVDWIIYGNPNRIEYDLVVTPQANPRQIHFKITGATHLSLDTHGNLLIAAGGQTLRALKPQMYQVTATGQRHAVTGHYVLDDQQVAFAVGAYEHTRPLIIDPTLVYSTYLGGSGDGFATAVAVDSSGDAYVTGDAGSFDFPTVNPLQATNTGGSIFISKFNASGSALIYSTYLGDTNGGENAHGIAVDNAGDVYVVGSTFSTNFPTVNAFQPANKSKGNPPEQAFVTKLNAAGDALVYSTYLGGSGESGASLGEARGIAVDGTGEAYVTGLTNSLDFPIVNAYQSTYTGRGDVFVTKFDAAGNVLIYSTFLGGSAFQEGDAIAVDAAGSAYVTGITNSTNFPLVNPYQATNLASVNSTRDTGFVAKFNPAGTALDYSTYLGGSDNYTIPQAIAVDKSGDAYIVGSTSSADFPVVNPFQSQLPDGSAAFVTKLSAAGSTLVYSTYLGGNIVDSASGIAVNSTGDARVVGNTASSDFPTVDALQATNKAAIVTGAGDTDGFITEFNAAGNALLFSTYWGGSGSWGPTQIHTTIPFGDSANAVALDNEGNVYVVGATGSADFPTCHPFQADNKTATTYGTDDNAFVTKISTIASGALPCSSAPSNPSKSTGSSGGGGATGWLSLLALWLVVLLREYKICNNKASHRPR